MNAPTDKYDEVARLLFEATGGTASDDDLQRLNQLLRDDPHLRRFAAQYLQDDVLLRDELGTAEAAGIFNDQAMLPAALSDAPSRRPGVVPHRWRSWTALLACGILIALLANAGLLWRNATPPGKATAGRPNTGLVTPAQPKIAGTLTLAVDCQWEHPLDLGEHLKPGEIKLLKGLARMNLTNGVELLLKGPAELRLASADHVVVTRGTVIASVHEEAIGFRLETPTTNVIDVGTEFAVSVDERGHSEVQVLNGAVTCLPSAGNVAPNPPLLTAGTATLFETRDDAYGRQVVSRANQLHELRRATDATSAGSRGNLQAYEGFEYPVGQIDTGNVGTGWAGPWRLGFDQDGPANVVIRDGQIMQPPSWLAGNAATYSVQPAGNLARRSLASPLNLSTDADYFVSFLIRKRIVGSTQNDDAGGGITLFAADDKEFGMAVSIDSRERITCWTGKMRYRGGDIVPADATCFLVMKIAARMAEPDNLLVRVFRSNDPPEMIEPTRWDCTGVAASLDGTLDVLTTWSGASAVTLIDEVRVGTTWASVVPVR